MGRTDRLARNVPGRKILYRLRHRRHALWHGPLTLARGKLPDATSMMLRARAGGALLADLRALLPSPLPR